LVWSAVLARTVRQSIREFDVAFYPSITVHMFYQR
jgi:hypothetical protein